MKVWDDGGAPGARARHSERGAGFPPVLAFAAFLLNAVVLLAYASLGVLGSAPPQDSFAAPPPPSETTWWKGNLHTHSLWSDGDSYPEMVVDWYRSEGYHFLALTEHDILQEAEKWIHPTLNEFTRGRGEATLSAYRERFGHDWVETRTIDATFLDELAGIPDSPPELERFARRPPEDHLIAGAELVRLRGLEEFRHFFETPGEFLLLPGIELSALTAHLNVTNLEERFPLQRGADAVGAMALNLEAARRQAEGRNRAMVAHINHPNFGWAVTAERMAEIEDARFVEVYNGHPLVENYGDELRVGVERMWDIVLTLRLAELGLGVIYGLAVDDTHELGAEDEGHATPGRGWVQVRAPSLTPEAILTAMDAGDFYASTGVVLRDVGMEGDRFEVQIAGEPGVSYRTQFIGTREGYDPRREPVIDADGNEVATTWRYSDDVGEVLAEVAGTSPSYVLGGDEIYLRARITSDRAKANPVSPAEEWEMAWTQPIVP